MDIAKLFGTNKSLESEGVWLDLGDGARIKVARMNNPSYLAKLKELGAQRKMALQLKNLPAEDLEKLMIKALAGAILVDFDGIEFNGKKLKYSAENAELLLTELPDFREFVIEQSSNIKNFQDQLEAEAEKNSLTA